MKLTKDQINALAYKIDRAVKEAKVAEIKKNNAAIEANWNKTTVGKAWAVIKKVHPKASIPSEIAPKYGSLYIPSNTDAIKEDIIIKTIDSTELNTEDFINELIKEYLKK